jgi:hypothetical protein
MRRCIVLAWLVGCSPGGSKTHDDGEPPIQPPGEDDPEAVNDREECVSYELGPCQPWFSRLFLGGAAADDYVVADLEDVGEPVCNGKGLLVDVSVFEDVDLVGIDVLSNSQCTAGCFVPCGFTNVCVAKDPEAQSCVHACTLPFDMDEAVCEAFLAECLGDPMACK